MDQSNIYDFLGIESDPLFRDISRLEKGQTLDLGEIKVIFNEYGIYEIATENMHEGFINAGACYERVSELGADLVGAI